LGQLEESFIIATDDEGLLLIDQHVAHERILFDKYRALEAERRSESQQLLVPETFDLTPAQAAVFDDLAPELEKYGFELMRLSGRTVAIKAKRRTRHVRRCVTTSQRRWPVTRPSKSTCHSLPKRCAGSSIVSCKPHHQQPALTAAP
jgi:hypothetical protein